jgi:hypothetical protein
MSDIHDLFSRAWDILQDRQIWEQKQRRFYVARHDGIRRRNKPFPTAADLHLALIDEKVNQKKAFTLAQVLGAPKLGTFISMKQQLAETTQSASDFFDFELKHRSNLLDVLDTVADTMWLRGRGIIKAYVDPYDDYKIVHESVDPLFLIMSDSANDFSDADEWVHVRQVSVNKFKNDRRYFNRVIEPMDERNLNLKINLIRGGKDALNRLKTQRGRDFDEIQLDKEVREGITHSNSSDTIIIWEHYVRTMGGITVYSYCPVAMDVEIRRPFGVPYKVSGRVSEGFFSFPAERKDEGWYSPRGIAEKVFDKEIYACKVWNAKADAMTFFNTPMLTSETPLQNPANYRMVPGEYMPGNVRPIQFGQPAISFDQEIAFARGEAELDSQSIDIGIEKPNNRGHEKRTAKEVGVASSLAQVGQNYAGGLFMKCMAKLLAFDWGLCLQYKRRNLTYFISDDLQTLPEQALHDEYLITPGGSPEDWDKTQKIQRAMSRLETLKGAPNVNQDELVRDLLTADDARLVKRLLLPQAQKAASEAEDEAMEIVIMTDGFPAQVKPGEDHLTRIKVLLGWLQKQGMQGAPLDKVAQQRIHEHLAAHMKFLQQLQPQAYKQLMQQIKQQEQQPMRPQVQAPPQRRQLAAPQPQSEMAMV